VGMFSFVGLYIPYIPCNWQVVFYRSGHIGHQVVTCAFDTSPFEMAITFCVWAVRFYSALLYIFYIEYILVIRGRITFYKEH
jgi:hypothetical protein